MTDKLTAIDNKNLFSNQSDQMDEATRANKLFGHLYVKNEGGEFVHALSQDDELFSHMETMDKDSVTQIENRASMERRLMDVQKRDCSILLIDADDFKSINDKYGHDKGDEVLRIIARRVAGNLKELDVLGRWGGDEFLALLEGHYSIDEIDKLANKLVMKINEPIKINGDLVNLGISLGGAKRKPDEEIGELLSRADVSMYKAKNLGKNTVVISRWPDENKNG